MKAKDIIRIYKSNPNVIGIAEQLRPNETCSIALKGLTGSLDAIVAASVYSLNNQTQIFILPDKEEAAYFQNDLQNLLPHKEILLFPTSCK